MAIKWYDFFFPAGGGEKNVIYQPIIELPKY